MIGTIGPVGAIARVWLVDEDRHEVALEYRNGAFSFVTLDHPVDWEPGDIVQVSQNGDRMSFEQMPPELWPQQSWVGVVRLRLDDRTVVSIGGQLRIFPTNDVEYVVGNTVEGNDISGILRILAEDPIRYLDIPDVDEAVADRFVRTGATLTFDDFGGLDDVKARARELIEVRLEHGEELEAIGARPIRGVLFTGPPGTGKTLLARIIANSSKAKFYEVRGPEIMSKWYGESEKILRLIFNRAAREERAIIFFDEIDSIAGQRSDEAHEESRRVVAQLLTMMDEFGAESNIVVIAATNRPQDIDAALRRPGRFDWEIIFRAPDQRERAAILEVSSRRLQTWGDLPHEQVAALTESWSGAELSAIWSEAALLAVADGRREIMAEDYLGGFARVEAQRRREVLGVETRRRGRD